MMEKWQTRLTSGIEAVKAELMQTQFASQAREPDAKTHQESNRENVHMNATGGQQKRKDHSQEGSPKSNLSTGDKNMGLGVMPMPPEHLCDGDHEYGY